MSAILSSKACFARQPFTAARQQPARAAARALVVLSMAKPVKASEFRSLSRDDIDTKVAELKRNMFAMRIKFAKREEYKKSEYLGLRRQIAKLLTVRREQEIAEGIDSRASRAADKAS